jgi:hypothetical protein
MPNDLDGLALDAWKAAMGDAFTAVKVLRDRTGLGLREALARIETTAHRVGGRCNLRLQLLTATEFTAKFSLPPSPENDARLTKHRAMRGIRKARGAK